LKPVGGCRGVTAYASQQKKEIIFARRYDEANYNRLLMGAASFLQLMGAAAFDG